MAYSILICDDDPPLAEEWREVVEGVVSKELYTLKPCEPIEKVRGGVSELLARRTAARSEGDIAREARDCVFDNVDILILDYDLLHIDEQRARYTGEGLARLARTFTKCGTIVVVNQFRNAHFDLSLRGNLWSHADLNLNADLLERPGLWMDGPWKGFRPWSWQTLYRAVETQRAREELVESRLGESIVDVLNMDEDDAIGLSDSAFGFVAPEAASYSDFSTRTFKCFLNSAVDGRDASATTESDPATASRFVAARMGKWLEREVLGPQDALIDVPHLIERYPFLMGNDVAELDAWNAAIHDPERLKAETPDGCWFEPAEFLARPAVWRHRFEADAEISERRHKYDYSDVPPFVFLEDTSEFAPLSEATEFRAGHHNAFDRRFVRYLADFSYAPQRRLAMAG